MKMKNRIRNILQESTTHQGTYYHGTRSIFPFQKFDKRMIGTGLVSNHTSYDGFFFTSDYEAAEFFTEWFICEVEIGNIYPNPLDTKNPSSVLHQGLLDGKTYGIDGYQDGNIFSDEIVVVPYTLLDDISIIRWMIADNEDVKEDLFEQYDKFFFEEEDYRDRDRIEEMLRMIEIDLDYLLSIPVFKEYWDLAE